MAERLASRFGSFVTQLTYSLEVFQDWDGLQGFLQHIADKTRRELEDRGVLDEEDEEEDEDEDEGREEEEDEEDDEHDDEQDEENKRHDDEEDERREEEEDEGHDGEKDREHEPGVSAHEHPDSSAPTSLPSCFHVHTVNNYATYEQLKKEQKEILDEGKVLTHLCNAFKTMPNIKRVVFTQSWRKPDQCWCEQVATDAARRSHNPWPMMLPCTEKNCSFVERHRLICVKPQTSYGSSRESIEWWKEMMLALEKTNKVLPELVMEIPRQNHVLDDVSISTDVFKPSHGLSEIIPNIFSKLTRLELSLDIYALDVNRVLFDAKALETLHISLAAPHWEELSEDFNQPGFSFSDALSGCTFPNLRSLSMDRYTATEEEILGFVRRTPDLRRLVLRRCRLRTYWVPLVRSLRDESNLQSLELNYVLGQFDVGSPVGELDGNENYLGPDLQKYFYSEKNSPFPEEFIKKHIEFRDRMDEALGQWFDNMDVNGQSE